MKNLYHHILKTFAVTILLLVGMYPMSNAQLTYLITMPPLVGNNGLNGVTFNVKAINSVTVQEIWCSFTGTQTVQVWYNPTDSVNGVPTVTAANGWVQLWTGTVTPAVGGYNTMDLIPIPSLSLALTANKTYGFYIGSTGTVNYSGTGSNTQPAQPAFEDANMKIYSGLNVGYGGSPAPSASYYVRQYNGKIGYISCQTPSGLAATGISETSANLSWTAVPGSVGYEYAITSTSTPPATGIGISATSYSPSGLIPNTTYYFHVRNKCSASNFSSWSTVSFKTLNSCAKPVNIVASPTGSTSVDVSWNPVAVTTGYEYVINNNIADPAGSGTTTANNIISVNSLTPNTTYYVHVRNVCGATSKSDWSTGMFVTPQCIAPSSIDIVNITSNTADLIWNTVSTAREYQYIVNTTRANPTSVQGASTSTTFINKLTLLMPGTKYYVHVRSLCFANDSSPWALDSFVTDAICNAPDVHLEKTTKDSILAVWTPSDNDYSYEYAFKNNNILPVSGVEVFEPKLSIVLPDDYQAYYLDVRRKCAVTMEYSPWTTVLIRRDDPTVVDQFESVTIKIYPNPVKDLLVIEINGSINENAQMELTDISGRVLSAVAVKSNKIEMKVSDYPAGLYFIKYTNGLRNYTKKINKI